MLTKLRPSTKRFAVPAVWHGLPAAQAIRYNFTALWDTIQPFLPSPPSAMEVAGLAATAGAATAGARAYLWKPERESSVVRNMTRVFEAGGQSNWDLEYSEPDSRAQVPRDEIPELQILLRPVGPVMKYIGVVGASGTGKSTTVRKAVRSLGSPKGIIYYMTPVAASEFSTGLATAVGYRKPFEMLASERKSELPPQDVMSAWLALAPLLRKAALAFREKHKRTPVLVIDAADRIAKQDPVLFSRLQDFAKECADNNVLRVVFVFSVGSTLQLFVGSAVASRAIHPFEVGDISDAAAIKYLVDTYGKDEKTAKEIVATIAGGRFPLLQELAIWTRSLEAWRRMRFVKIRDILNDLDLQPSNDLFQALLAAAKEGHALDLDKAHTLLGKDKVQVLLKNNIVVQHPGNTYTFHSRYIVDFASRHAELAQQKVKTELV